jgi:hypothetical protein
MSSQRNRKDRTDIGCLWHKQVLSAIIHLVTGAAPIAPTAAVPSKRLKDVTRDHFKLIGMFDSAGLHVLLKFHGAEQHTGYGKDS